MAETKAPAAEQQVSGALSERAARNLATTSKTRVQVTGTTPRWVLRLLPWVAVQSGTYRVNRRRMVVAHRAKIDLGGAEDPSKLTPAALRAIPFLGGVDDENLVALIKQVKAETFNAGDAVLREGAGGNRMYIVASGKVEVSTAGSRGEKLRVAVLGAGEYFGEMSLVEGGPRSATVEALSACTLLGLTHQVFERLMKQVPAVREQVTAAVEKRRRELESVNEYGEAGVPLSVGNDSAEDLPQSFVDYEDLPPEYPLHAIQTVMQMHTRVADLYNDPINQLEEQLRLTIEEMKERQEWELINNAESGLLRQPPASMRVQARYGAPTPDDMDELLSKVWKEPAYFLAHPRAIAAFGRECTRRGVPPPTVNMFGSPFLTWRGVPIVPCDKLLVDGKTRPMAAAGSTNILLMRVGEDKHGVVGLHQPGVPGEQSPSLSVRWMGTNQRAVAEYLVTLYFNCAVLTEDALGVLEGVQVGSYYDYPRTA